MKWPIALVMTASFAFSAQVPKTFVGVVHDNRCVGANCATQCPVNKEPVYTLQAGDDAFVLTSAKHPDEYVGKKVSVTGTLAGNKLKVTSITSAR
jgi:hypothetical protein